jgi:hypothetical protein
MKTKFLLFFLFSIALMSCKKEDDEPGSVSIKVSYYYNAYQGYKPDVGAKAYLHDVEYISKVHLDSLHPIAAKVGLLIDKNGDFLLSSNNGVTYNYSGEADVSGQIDIPNVGPGDYYLVVASEGRYTFSTKRITVGSGTPLTLVKNFYYLHDFDYGGESW